MRSNIFLEADKNKYLDLKFYPEEISLVSGSVPNGSSIKIKAKESSPDQIYHIGVRGDVVSAPINFPRPIDSSQNSEYDINESVIIVENLFQINVHRLSPEDWWKEFTGIWIIPLAPVWGFLGGVLAVVIPLIARRFDKKRKKKHGQ